MLAVGIWTTVELRLRLRDCSAAFRISASSSVSPCIPAKTVYQLFVRLQNHCFHKKKTRRYIKGLLPTQTYRVELIIAVDKLLMKNK